MTTSATQALALPVAERPPPMYSTCLFCNASLGSNESIEHFPVGRRLAYDEAKGRLWVVCRKCDRWNLSPLEERWEAIEEAEQKFRATKTRVATENIGLAKLADGTELVRIGKPPKIELAVWRYGNQFRSRYRKHTALAVTGTIVGSTTVLFLGGPLHSPNLLLSLPIAFGISAAVSAGRRVLQQKLQRWYGHAIPQVGIRSNGGELLRLTQQNIDAARLRSIGLNTWELSVPHVTTQPAGSFARLLRHPEETSVIHEPILLNGDAALNAMANLLPRTNREGANKEGVDAAMRTIDESSNLATILRMISGDQTDDRVGAASGIPGRTIATAPSHVRLALEMSLHAEDERRAMEGALHELEQRWRDADAIAKIADEMFMPSAVEEQLRGLQQDTQRGEQYYSALNEDCQ